jgi:hypothetical protein
MEKQYFVFTAEFFFFFIGEKLINRKISVNNTSMYIFRFLEFL